VLDDLSHYLFHCPATKEVWVNLQEWWKNCTDEQITLTEQHILLGLSMRQKKLKIQDQLNVIGQSAKWRMVLSNSDLNEANDKHKEVYCYKIYKTGYKLHLSLFMHLPYLKIKLTILTLGVLFSYFR
jgi:hypothetical protein